jgi:hypothetical protein
MQTNYARTSIVILGISYILLIALTAFESALLGTSPGVQRIFTLVLLVLPASVGSFFGALSLSYREGRTWLAITGIILNAVFAIFHLAIILFAG